MTAREPVPPRKASPFFQLPGELRNAIYGFLPCRDRVFQAPTVDCAYRVWRRNIPKIYLLLVNKQFENEYRDRASKRRVVRIEDTRMGRATAFQLPPGPEPTRLTCDLYCLIGEHSHDLKAHAEMIESILHQMKNPPSVQLTIYFEYHGHETPDSARELINDHQPAFSKLTSVANLDCLGLYVR